MNGEDFTNPNYVMHFQREGGIDNVCRAPGPDKGLYAAVSQRADGVTHGTGVVVDGVSLTNGRLVTEVKLSDRGHRATTVLEIVTRRDALPAGQTGDPLESDNPTGTFLVLPNGVRIVLAAALDALQQALFPPTAHGAPTAEQGALHERMGTRIGPLRN